ncbi:MAG: hypothetical protein ACRDG8_01540 [Actinomycetota bacterium]
MPPGLQLIDVQRRFGDVVALNGVTFDVDEGSVVGAIVIGSTALLVPLAGRVYAGAIFRTGAKVKLRDAWRAAA